MRSEKSQAFENKEVRIIQVKSGELNQKDVKNEGWPDYMLENTDEVDKMSLDQPA
ncbi:MAG: hypothetical protein ABSG32_25130 [Terriglobia bacterium]|jgi:hypothetical protein